MDLYFLTKWTKRYLYQQQIVDKINESRKYCRNCDLAD